MSLLPSATSRIHNHTGESMRTITYLHPSIEVAGRRTGKLRGRELSTRTVDALLDDEPGAYRGRHRRDMPLPPIEHPDPKVGALSHTPRAVATNGEHGTVIAACGAYTPGAPFVVSGRARHTPRHAHPDPAELALALYLTGGTL